MSGRRVEGGRLPGELLRRLGRRLCSDATYEHLIEPLIADLQHEYVSLGGDRSRAAAILVRASGVAAFWRALLVHAATTTWRGEPIALSCRGVLLRRLGAWSVAAVIALSALLEVTQPSQATAPLGRAKALVYLLPSSVAFAVPFALLIGCALAVRHVEARLASVRERRAVVRSVLACSWLAVGATFVLTAWVLPRSNQAYRQAVWTATTGSDHALEKGDRELTLGELSGGARALRAQGRYQAAARYDVELHKRVALPLACMVFAVLGAAFGLDARLRAAFLGLACIAFSFGYYILIRVGEDAGDRMLLSPFIAAWGPNLLFGLVGTIWVLLASRSVSASMLAAPAAR